MIEDSVSHLVVNQVVECNYTSNQRRQVYYQHHIIRFHYTRKTGINNLERRTLQKTITFTLNMNSHS